jgi:uncharacterized protein (AIM24 family)
MNCKTVGYDLKALHVELLPGDTFFCEKGSIIYYEEGLSVNAKLVDSGGLVGLFKRKVSGESMFMVEMHNPGSQPKKGMVAGKMGILPVDLKQFPSGILCRASYYVASSGQVDIDFQFDLSSFMGGMGPILQKLTGFCTVFLDSIGSPIPITLKYGESVIVDERSLICLDARMNMNLSTNFNNMLAGEGFSMLRITGPGLVYVNSVNIVP